jgi:hypothetical protein
MKFQAPPGVTALSCAGEDIIPDAQGCFEAAENLADDLVAHGCVPAPPEADANTSRAKKQKRAEKAD